MTQQRKLSDDDGLRTGGFRGREEDERGEFVIRGINANNKDEIY